MKKTNKHLKQTIYGIAIMWIGLLANAGAAHAAGVSLSANPAAQTVTVGQAASYTINLSRDGYTDKVTLSATNLPVGGTAGFSPNPVTGTSSILKLQTAANTPVGTFTITVKGTANGITIAPITVKLTTQAAPSLTVSVAPQTQYIVAGHPTAFDIAINRLNFDGPATLSAENLPTGVTVRFDPESTSGNSSRMYLYSNGLQFLQGEYSMIVRASALGDTVRGRTNFKMVVNCGVVWATQFGTPNNQTLTSNFANDVTTDPSGNVYATGHFFDSGAGDLSAWVAKYDKFGNQIWVRALSGQRNDVGTEVFVDPAGNVYIAGHMEVTTNGFIHHNIFVAKFSANGTQNPNVRSLGTNFREGFAGMQFGTDAAGRTILTAPTEVDDTGRGTDDLGNELRAVSFDISRFTFDANFNVSGQTTPLFNEIDGNPRDLVVTPDGAIHVVRENLNHTVFVNQLGGIDVKDVTISLMRLNSPPGQQNFETAFIDPTPSSATPTYTVTNLSVDPQRPRLFVAGKTDFNGSSVQGFDGLGNQIWVREFLSPQMVDRVNVLSLAADGAGDVYFAGATFGSLSGVNPDGNSDAFFGKLAGASGNQINLQQFNASNLDSFNAVRLGGSGELLFAGHTVAFFPQTFGNEDALLMKYNLSQCVLW